MQRAFIIHALSPLHPGTGQAQGAIDLPIARLKGSGIPYLPGSSVKGVIRDAHRGAERNDKAKQALSKRVFGPEVKLDTNEERSAGALAFGDARLLALPVRSFSGTFAWVTSPLLLWLAERDLHWGLDIPGADAPPRETWIEVTTDSLLGVQTTSKDKPRVYLEDIDCPIRGTHADLSSNWAAKIAADVFPTDADTFTRRFAVVDDETMTFLWETCTQVDARVRIGEEGVVAKGALWYEESLPTETLLLGLAAHLRNDPDPQVLFDHCLQGERSDLQFGGKATVGRGRARLIALTPAASATKPREGTQ